MYVQLSWYAKKTDFIYSKSTKEKQDICSRHCKAQHFQIGAVTSYQAVSPTTVASSHPSLSHAITTTTGLPTHVTHYFRSILSLRPSGNPDGHMPILPLYLGGTQEAAHPWSAPRATTTMVSRASRVRIAQVNTPGEHRALPWRRAARPNAVSRSLHSGGATLIANCSATGYALQATGHWTSGAYRLYVHRPAGIPQQGGCN